MNSHNPSLLKRLVDRVFPKMPDFFSLLSEQSVMVGHTVNLLVLFMETHDAAVGEEVRKNEHEADKIKARNIHVLNEAFSTPIDREDIYRAIADLDQIVVYCKTTVSEMNDLEVAPNDQMREMARQLKHGVDALIKGFGRLGSTPHEAEADADEARHADRKTEKIYRHALAELFQGDDYIGMFKRREIYRHLANASHRMAHAANTLHDIVVKIT